MAGNLIGTDITGTVAIANGNDGVEIDAGARGNTIGGTTPGAGNVISGNAGGGVEIAGGGGTSGNVVTGNLIGTDIAGTAAIANGDDGVEIDFGRTANTIGGTTPGAGNVISGNAFDGVEIDRTGTSGNIVAGNFIGTDITGTVAIGNGSDGVVVVLASGNTIGGTTTGARNVISGNAHDGVEIHGAGRPATLWPGT